MPDTVVEGRRTASTASRLDLRVTRALLATPVTFTLVLAGVVLFVAEVTTGTTQRMLEVLGLSSTRVRSGGWWRLVTVLLTDPATWGPHPLSLANSAMLLVLGRRLERIVGPGRMAATYLTTAVAVSLMVVVLLPRWSDFAAGSSGAVAGVGGSLGTIRAVHAVQERNPRRFPWALLLIAIVLTALSLVGAPAISNIGHVTGVVTGATAGLLFAIAHPMVRSA